jgi:ACS family sodium-dependent inorganic phosphate cotransporter
VNLTLVRKTMQITGLTGAALFMLAARDVTSADTAFLLMCGALGTLALTWAGFLPNHLEIAPRYADVLMGITNTAGTVPGVVGVALTGWLVEATGTYDAAFLLAAGVNLTGAVVWLFFGTARKVVD